MNTIAYHARRTRRACRAAVAVGITALAVSGASATAQPLGARVVSAAARPADTLIVDFITRRATHVRGGRLLRSDIRPGATVDVPKPYALHVRIANTNSSLYACSMTDEKTSVPELDSLRSFLTAFGPYLPAVLSTVGTPVVAMMIPDAASRTARDAVKTMTLSDQAEAAPLIEAVGRPLARLDSLVHTPWGDARPGLDAARRRVLTSLQGTHSADGNDPATHANALARDLTAKRLCASPACDRLLTIGTLLETLDSLQQPTFALERWIAQYRIDHDNDDTKIKGAVHVAGRARTALGDADKLLAAAYALEKLMDLASHASASIPCDVVQGAWDEGRAAKISVAPRKDAELARLAAAAPVEFTLDAQPQWWVRPSVGLALVYARHARFGTYTVADNVVTPDADRDDRFTYGLTLGLSYPRAHVPRLRNVTFSLPEFIINPTDEVRAIGVGVGASVGLFKLGVGRLWTKHDVPTALNADGTPAAGARLRATYSSPRGRWGDGFVSVAVTGWPPFVR